VDDSARKAPGGIALIAAMVLAAACSSTRNAFRPYGPAMLAVVP